jgi:hypothetical protein
MVRKTHCSEASVGMPDGNGEESVVEPHCRVSWHTPAIPALGRQKDGKFKASLGYIVRACLNTTTTKGGHSGSWEKSRMEMSAKLSSHGQEAKREVRK